MIRIRAYSSIEWDLKALFSSLIRTVTTSGIYFQIHFSQISFVRTFCVHTSHAGFVENLTESKAYIVNWIMLWGFAEWGETYVISSGMQCGETGLVTMNRMLWLGAQNQYFNCVH